MGPSCGPCIGGSFVPLVKLLAATIVDSLASMSLRVVGGFEASSFLCSSSRHDDHIGGATYSIGIGHLPVPLFVVVLVVVVVTVEFGLPDNEGLCS